MIRAVLPDLKTGEAIVIVEKVRSAGKAVDEGIEG